jgi:hypothetical protein
MRLQTPRFGSGLAFAGTLVEWCGARYKARPNPKVFCKSLAGGELGAALTGLSGLLGNSEAALENELATCRAAIDA